MPDFRVVQIRVELLTPESKYQPKRFLGYFLAKWGELLGGEPVSSEQARSGGRDEPEPWLKLQSRDTLLAWTASRSRVGFSRSAAAWSDRLDLRQAFGLATELIADYIQAMEARPGAIGCKVTRAVEDTDPSRAIARHFCRQDWLDGPLNRPDEFEIKATQSSELAEGVRIWSVFRAGSGAIEFLAQSGDRPAPASTIRSILIEQDLQMPEPEVAPSPDRLREFLGLAADALDATFRGYFPESEATDGSA